MHHFGGRSRRRWSWEAATTQSYGRQGQRTAADCDRSAGGTNIYIHLCRHHRPYNHNIIIPNHDDDDHHHPARCESLLPPASARGLVSQFAVNSRPVKNALLYFVCGTRSRSFHYIKLFVAILIFSNQLKSYLLCGSVCSVVIKGHV